MTEFVQEIIRPSSQNKGFTNKLYSTNTNIK